MKFKLPELNILENEGFAHDKDIFNRKNFGEKLGNIFASADDGLVIALNGGWGEGKSTFIQMWRGHVTNREKNPLRIIYFDAFKNDFQKDPFLAIASEIYESLPQKQKVKLKSSILKTGKAIARGGLKLSLRVGTAGILDGGEVDVAEKEASKIFGNQIESLIDDRLKSSSTDQKRIFEFTKHLEDSIKGTGIDKEDDIGTSQTVFVIDELDRCKPDFALAMLEVIKHFFYVPSLSFLLVVNRKQLEAAIRGRYGNEVEAEQYLNKFIHLFASIPNGKSGFYDKKNSTIFFGHCLNKMTNLHNSFNLDILRDLVTFFSPSFREIERIVASYNIACSAGLVKFDGRSFDYETALVTFVIWESVLNPSNLHRIQSNELNGAEVVEASGLLKFRNLQKSNACYVHEMLDLVKFDKGNDEERKAMVDRDDSTINGCLKYGQSADTWRLHILSIASIMANISSS